MPTEPPEHSGPVSTFMLAIGIAIFGGLVRWIAMVKKGEVEGHRLMGLIGELATSAFAGMLAYWLCQWAGLSETLILPLVGMSGHMGTRAIAAIESGAAKRFGVQP